jgi:predicted O-methyltransferase YrrM
MWTRIKDAALRLPGLGFVKLQRQRFALAGVGRAACDPAHLARNIDQHTVTQMFLSSTINKEWPEIEHEIAGLKITDKAGGVNPGDRRALYYLVRFLRSQSILEIGTHIGASTVHMAAALRSNHSEAPGYSVRLSSIDIIDVNDPGLAIWIKYGSTYSPRELIMRIGMTDYVTFITSPSIEYLAHCNDRYDLIFLDGDHSARAVYREITMALPLLNKGGVILLHDYFPYLRQLWPGSSPLPGPWLGTQRLKAEGANIRILPLGHLPWPTKLNSNVTSLALVVGGR